MKIPEVLLARLASGHAMGQAQVESALLGRLTSASVPGMRVAAADIAGRRGEGARCLPRRLVGKSAGTDRLLSAWVYRRADLVHRLDGRLPPARREVLTVHDMAWLHFDDEGRPGPALAAQARRAAAVTTVSEFSGQELQERWRLDRVHVIPNGCDPAAHTAVPLSASQLQSLGISRPFAIVTGGATQRKNLAMLADAWRAVSADATELQLVLAGPADPRRTRLFDGLDRVVLTDYLERETLLGLMASATIVVVPSRYEGFGLPVLEAMAVGTPVVCTNASSLPEVAGDAALLVDLDVDALAAGMLTLLRDQDLAASLVARGKSRSMTFTWEAAAAAYLKLYRDLLAG